MVNSGKAMVVGSPVKAAADRYQPPPVNFKGEEATGSGPLSMAARSACGMEVVLIRPRAPEGKAGIYALDQASKETKKYVLNIVPRSAHLLDLVLA